MWFLVVTPIKCYIWGNNLEISHQRGNMWLVLIQSDANCYFLRRGVKMW